MASATAILTIYDPPKSGLPYLVATIWPDGKVDGVAANSLAEAQTLYDQIAGELAAAGAGSETPPT